MRRDLRFSRVCFRPSVFVCFVFVFVCYQAIWTASALFSSSRYCSDDWYKNMVFWRNLHTSPVMIEFVESWTGPYPHPVLCLLCHSPRRFSISVRLVDIPRSPSFSNFIASIIRGDWPKQPLRLPAWTEFFRKWINLHHDLWLIFFTPFQGSSSIARSGSLL